jgi:hypothetical protein
MTEDWKAAAAAEAQALFAGTFMVNAAVNFAGLTPRAIQYLRAAPVLLAARLERRQLQASFEGGRKLRDIMAAARFPLALRKLAPAAIGAATPTVFRMFNNMPPSLLSQIIPDDAQHQRRWLYLLLEWGRRRMGVMANVGPDHAEHPFFWAAERLAGLIGDHIDPAEVRRVADFAYAPDVLFNPDWGWRRAVEAAGQWERRRQRVALQRVVVVDGAGRRYEALVDAIAGIQIRHLSPAQRFDPHEVLDKGGHDDETTIGAVAFRALRTAAALHDEGARMEHCVANYAGDVASGAAHIFSVLRDGRPVATLELDRTYSISQLQGFRNRPPAPDVRDAAQAFSRLLGGQVAEPARAYGGERRWVGERGDDFPVQRQLQWRVIDAADVRLELGIDWAAPREEAVAIVPRWPRPEVREAIDLRVVIERETRRQIERHINEFTAAAARTGQQLEAFARAMNRARQRR